MGWNLPIATQAASTYKANIDASAARNFGVYANTTPDMYMNVGAGSICLNGTTTNYAAQLNLAELTAPVSNPRIDRVVVDLFTGVASIVAGSEAASPVAPDVPPGKVSAAQITLQTSTTAITDAMIENEFPVILGNPVFTTATLSPTGDATKDFGRICRITLNAQLDASEVVVKVGRRSNRCFAVFNISTTQTSALNNDPLLSIQCIDYNTILSNGNPSSSPVITPTSLVGFYTISATESYVDIYLASSVIDDQSYWYQFDAVSLYGTAAFTPYNAETPIAALSWDATSAAALGVIVYDQTLTLDNNFTSGTANVIAVRCSGGYMVTCAVHSSVTHSSTHAPISTALISTAYRPKTHNAGNIVEISATRVSSLYANTAGTISLLYKDWAGANSNQTGLSQNASVTYFVPD